MDDFDKRLALDVIEDALTSLAVPENRGFAMGLCGGFYLCGLLTEAEWEGFLERIAEKREAEGAGADIYLVIPGEARPTTLLPQRLQHE